MPIQVQGPDGQLLEFPDGTPRETMKAAMQKRYGAPKAAAPTEAPADPTEGMSGLDKFMAGVGKSVVDTGRGLKQAGTDAARYFVEEGLGMEAPGLRRSLAEQQAAIDESRRLDAPLMDTGAGLAGNVTGYAAQVLVPGAALRGTSAARAALPTTVAGNAAQGGVLGLLQPVASGDTRIGQGAVGTAFGAGGAALAKGAGAGVSGLAKLAGVRGVSRAEKGAADILKREAGGLQGLMQMSPSGVPGVARTMGEETLEPGVMALENTMRAQHRGVFDPVDTRNNLARVSQLQKIAGDDVAMNEAIDARDLFSSRLRDKAFSEGDEAERLGMKYGASLAGNVESLRSAFGAIAQQSGGRSSVKRTIEEVVKELDDAELSVRGLYNVRKSINDLLEGKAGSDKSYAKAATREMMEMRNMLDDEISNIAPSFREYVTSYRDLSKPINRMEMGRDLLNRGSASVRDETGTERILPGTFAKANDLDSMAQKATGFPKAKAEDILSADDIKLISQIQDDLQRQLKRQSSATAGSQTFERGAVADRLVTKGMRMLPFGVGGVVEALEASGNKRVQERLAYLIANPEEARHVLSKLEPKQRSAINKVMFAIAARGARTAGASTGATYSADQPLDIDIVGGTPISVEQARSLYGP